MMYDYLIVGRGLAGSLIGYRLERTGLRVMYFDHPGQTSASSVAAGIVNPVTGRRFVKSWRIDELLPEVRRLYRALEAELNATFFYETPLIRTLFNRGDRNQWDTRSGLPGYAEYLDDNPSLGRYETLVHPAFSYGGVRHAGRVEIGRLVTALRQRVEGRCREEAFHYDRLERRGDHFTYGDLTFRRIIFCEGWRGRENPWFSYLPFGGAKGEILNVTLPVPLAEGMLKHHVFLVPQSNGSYWVGATTDNRFTDDRPTPENAAYLEERLADLVREQYHVNDHRAAVRPTVRDRRPFLGAHPTESGFYIFNGLGTKGASLAPLMSRWLVDFLLKGTPIPPEVNISRFT